MKKRFVNPKKDICWYVNQNPIEKYLKIDRVNNQTVSKFVCVNIEAHINRKKTQYNLRRQTG